MNIPFFLYFIFFTCHFEWLNIYMSANFIYVSTSILIYIINTSLIKNHLHQLHTKRFVSTISMLVLISIHTHTQQSLVIVVS